MKISIPNKPTGQTHYHQFVIAVWEYLFNGRFPFVDTDTVKWSRGPTGYAAAAAPPSAGGKGGKTTSDYAGLYVPGQTYNALEWVVIQSGNGAGAYISTADGNKNLPTTGINWVQFSALPQWF